jgi:hypothetical protein
MRRVLVLTAVAAISITLAGCRESIVGSLIVSEALSLRSSSGVFQLPAGQYPVRVIATGARTFSLGITRDGRQIVTEFTADARHADGASTRIPSTESGQPFDVVFAVSASTLETPLASSRTSCQTETTESRCRDVTEYDFQTGQQTVRSVCEFVQVTRAGARTESTFRRTSSRTVSGQLVDPQSGRAVAHLSAASRRERTHTVESGCVELGRIR